MTPEQRKQLVELLKESSRLEVLNYVHRLIVDARFDERELCAEACENVWLRDGSAVQCINAVRALRLKRVRAAAIRARTR